jgi:hypothetical protein
MDMLAHAKSDFETTLHLEDFRADSITKNGANAAIYLSFLPIYKRLLIDNSCPTQNELSKTYHQLIQIGQKLIDSFNREEMRGSKTADQLSKTTDLRGILAEVSVMLALTRFSITEIGDGSWFGAPSFLSQNLARKSRGSHLNDAWDISVFSAPSNTHPPQLTYKIQVKAQKTAYTQDEEYADDIVLINQRNDMHIHQRSKFSNVQGAGFIVANCAREIDADTDFETRQKSKEKLDKATNLLLEKIDN